MDRRCVGSGKNTRRIADEKALDKNKTVLFMFERELSILWAQCSQWLRFFSLLNHSVAVVVAIVTFCAFVRHFEASSFTKYRYGE